MGDKESCWNYLGGGGKKTPCPWNWEKTHLITVDLSTTEDALGLELQTSSLSSFLCGCGSLSIDYTWPVKYGSPQLSNDRCLWFRNLGFWLEVTQGLSKSKHTKPLPRTSLSEECRSPKAVHRGIPLMYLWNESSRDQRSHCHGYLQGGGSSWEETSSLLGMDKAEL